MRARPFGELKEVPSQTWTAPAEPGRVADLRHRAVAFAGENAVPDPPIADLKLAVSEAVTNAVVHAFADGEPGTITLTVQVEPHRVKVSVVDDGRGLKPRTDSPGLGLGLPLIATVADDFEVRPAPTGHGTELCMAFSFETPATMPG